MERTLTTAWYTLFTGSEGTVTSWLPSRRQESGRSLSRAAAVNVRLKKLKRLQWLGWSLIIVGIILLFIVGLVYFVLGKCDIDDFVRRLRADCLS